MAKALLVTCAECEIVELVRNGSKELGNCTLSSCKEFNCNEVEVIFVNELHSFEGLNDPTR